jgi:hypothetical protein
MKHEKLGYKGPGSFAQQRQFQHAAKESVLHQIQRLTGFRKDVYTGFSEPSKLNITQEMYDLAAQLEAQEKLSGKPPSKQKGYLQILEELANNTISG